MVNGFRIPPCPKPDETRDNPDLTEPLMNESLSISVIIPVRDNSVQLGRCLDALAASTQQPLETIVVDNASMDESGAVGRRKGARVLRLDDSYGPATARNFGAQQASGEAILFVDSDVLVRAETVASVMDIFVRRSEIAAVFGSYDDSPEEKNFFSQYKNLFHHYTHQNSNIDAVTFWTGCGAVRREVFNAVGGFDQSSSKPCVEDIELGYRMRKMGYRILLDKSLQVKHLKHWELGSLLQAEIFYRAIPWSNLILDGNQMVNDLTLKLSDRISAGIVGVLALTLPFTVLSPLLLLFQLSMMAVIFSLNYNLCRFFFRCNGLWFATRAFLFHLVYYFYSGATFVLCSIWWTLSRRLKLRDRSRSNGVFLLIATALFCGA